jgi:hypothetical protein
MSDPVWVTYAEAAKRLGISVEGVRLKVKRDQKLGKDAKLRVRRDNSGRMLLAWDKALLGQRGVTRGIPHVGEDVGVVGAPDAEIIASLAKLLAQQHADHVAVQAQQRADHQVELERVRDDHAAELKRIRDELERARQDADRQDRLHREQRAEVEHLLKALVERVQADQTRLIEERAQLQEELQEARAEADHAKSDQMRMARDIATMFDKLRAMADLHADRARLEAGLERLQDERNRAVLDADQAQEEIKRQRDHANALLSQVEDLNGSLDQMRRERQAEVGRLRAELKQERIRWWHRWFKQ